MLYKSVNSIPSNPSLNLINRLLFPGNLPSFKCCLRFPAFRSILWSFAPLSTPTSRSSCRTSRSLSRCRTSSHPSTPWPAARHWPPWPPRSEPRSTTIASFLTQSVTDTKTLSICRHPTTSFTMATQPTMSMLTFCRSILPRVPAETILNGGTWTKLRCSSQTLKVVRNMPR